MAIVCVDWRKAPKAVLAGLYAAEIDRWSTTLGWETAASWDHVELGRRLGTVAGLLALDANGAVAGWSFYLLHRGALQIGGFAADSAAVTQALVGAIFTSAAAAAARSVAVFVFSDAPGLSSALARRGLTVGAHDYLSKNLVDGAVARECGDGVRATLRRWRSDDGEAVAALLGDAYPGASGVRPFAPGGTVEEWQEYVGQLVDKAGCGILMPEACYVVASAAHRLAGVVLVTRLASATAHIAQLAVGPAGQRRGLGGLLVRTACASARDAGCDRITLMVDSRNLAARRLYEAASFHQVASFVSAGTTQPVRVTSIAVGAEAVIRP